MRIWGGTSSESSRPSPCAGGSFQAVLPARRASARGGHPRAIRPIYFDAFVSPDPTLPATSVDGGVLFDNLAPGTYTLAASKAPFSYAPVTFRVDAAIPLYISSPPHSLQGTNTSGPGLP